MHQFDENIFEIRLGHFQIGDMCAGVAQLRESRFDFRIIVDLKAMPCTILLAAFGADSVRQFTFKFDAQYAFGKCVQKMLSGIHRHNPAGFHHGNA